MDAKYHINNRFGACHHIANARDEHRNRDVRLFHIPGEFEYIGINDGVDCWICPVKADPFSANTPRLLEDIRAGKIVHAQPLSRPRKTAPPAQMELRPASRERRVVPQPVQQPVSRPRRVA